MGLRKAYYISLTSRFHFAARQFGDGSRMTLTLYTLTSVSIFSILVSSRFFWSGLGEFVLQSKHLRLVIISFILVILMNDLGELLQGEFGHWSLLRLKCGENEIVAHKAQMSVSLMFLSFFDVVCDLLVNRPWQHSRRIYLLDMITMQKNGNGDFICASVLRYIIRKNQSNCVRNQIACVIKLRVCEQNYMHFF